MELNARQLEQFDRDGFLVLPDLFSRNEVAVLRREVARLAPGAGRRGGARAYRRRAHHLPRP